MCDTPFLDTDIVAGFSALCELSEESRSELTSWKDRLGLRLSVERLMTCAGLYTERAPSVGELRFVDRLLDECASDPTLSPPVAFQTSDQTTAATFARLVERLRGSLSQTPPLTFQAAWSTLGEQAGVCALSYPRLTTIPDIIPQAFEGQGTHDAIRLDHTFWYAALPLPTPAHRSLSLKAGDLCSLLALPPDADWASIAPLASLLSDKTRSRNILHLCAVNKADLLPTLLSLKDDWQVDLSAIDGLCEQPPHVALSHLPTGLLICADEKSTRVLCDKVRALGFSMSAFARVGTDRQLTMTTHGQTDFSLSTALLRSLLLPRPTRLSILPCDEPVNAHENVSTTAISLGEWRLTYTSLPLSPSISARQIEAIVLKLSKAAGIAPTSEPPRLSVGLVAGKGTTPNALWATVLGLLRYRDEGFSQIVSQAYTFDPSAAEGELTLCLITPRQEALADEESDNFAADEPSDVENV